jgi:alkylation response protein AidB-like acyl-CoA dehydrogenase
MAPGQGNDGLWKELQTLAERADVDRAWPAASWDCLHRAGGLTWCIPTTFGGLGLAGPDLLRRYEALAGTCLTTCFILSQRDAACRRIREHGNDELQRELLPALARCDRFATVGLSHLTTSRQHVRPALVAREERDHLVLDGFMPWVTGAAQADYLVTGAVLTDGRQILLVLPARLEGVRVGFPLELTALAGSVTSEVYCDRVRVARNWLLAGPSAQILATGRGGSGGLETSCLALGLAGAAVGYLEREATARPELRTTAERLGQARLALRSDLHRASEVAGTPDEAARLRSRANALVLRATQASLTASKGTGFVHPHPAQRWARQALFFLVWSCPRPAAEATLELLAPASEFDCPE